MNESTTLTDTLSTQAEVRAEAAEALPAFSGFKLLHVKRQLTIMLSLIGRDSIFDQYTRHDITHINELLLMTDWVVPADTKKHMSPADWLLLVLAIYFHDFGMLVTKDEYVQRNTSAFPQFRDQSLLAGDGGADFKAKLMSLPAEDAERFLYQEYVRLTHAARIRAWIAGEAPKVLGINHPVMHELDTLLSSLPPLFRRDLGVVCESHHLDDLIDFKKYRVSQPYGSNLEATANVQYAAIVLRTVDLLHMTSDRTPSVAFRLINPSDPISQREWAKQHSVSSVRPKPPRNKEGEVDPELQADTVEVHALFRDADGFFALTSFLFYVRSQLRKNYEWVKASVREGALRYAFPWREISDENVEAMGFINKRFEFSLDQAKILDLLTGHTLYNDTRVVLRELVQNSVDAVRVQELTDPTMSGGTVRIGWNSNTRVLTVQDDGTGMTQDIVEQHLLKVGSSRYQDSHFKKQHPKFTPISRFGIGILSCFMIADAVDIFTVHPEESEGRHLSLRNVHGRYLVRLLDKHDDPDAAPIGSHGTIIRLHVRPTADMSDIEQAAERWILVPACHVLLSVDASTPKRIGYDSPHSALIAQLERDGMMEDVALSNLRVHQVERDGVALAYALQWDQYFKEWAFVPIRARGDDREILLGIAVEGIRVEFSTPGFQSTLFYAIANASGLSAPRTNVARSGLEEGPELDAALRTIYGLYCDHVRNELWELEHKREYSLTWASGEAYYLLQSFLPSTESHYRIQRTHAKNDRLLQEQIESVPFVVLEREGRRFLATIAECLKEEHMWTVDSELMDSVERLLSEAPSVGSIHSVLEAIGTRNLLPQSELLLCDLTERRHLILRALRNHDVDKIVVHSTQRRVDLRWTQRTSAAARWMRIPSDLLTPSIVSKIEMRRQGRFASAYGRIHVCQSAIDVVGLNDETAVRAFGDTYILDGSHIAKLMLKWFERTIKHGSDGDVVALVELCALVEDFYTSYARSGVSMSRDRVQAGLRHMSDVAKRSDVEELLPAIEQTNWRMYDVRMWNRENRFVGRDDDIPF